MWYAHTSSGTLIKTASHTAISLQTGTERVNAGWHTAVCDLCFPKLFIWTDIWGLSDYSYGEREQRYTASTAVYLWHSDQTSDAELQRAHYLFVYLFIHFWLLQLSTLSGTFCSAFMLSEHTQNTWLLREMENEITFGITGLRGCHPTSSSPNTSIPVHNRAEPQSQVINSQRLLDFLICTHTEDVISSYFFISTPTPCPKIRQPEPRDTWRGVARHDTLWGPTRCDAAAVRF